jgi:hypothetical protein
MRYTWFTPVWGYIHQPLRLLYYSSTSYIQLLLFTKPQSQASHRIGNLCTEHQILLPKLCLSTELTSLLSIDPYIHILLHKETQNYLHLDTITIHYLATSTIHSYLFTLLQSLTIRHKHGRTHGSTSHNPLQKP